MLKSSHTLNKLIIALHTSTATLYIVGDENRDSEKC